MNTVGKHGQLADRSAASSPSPCSPRAGCENSHACAGNPAFGTQLLCEQVIGRALRRQSYDLNEGGLFNVEYADVLGIPFDFTAKPVVSPRSRRGRLSTSRPCGPNAMPSKSASPCRGLPRRIARGKAHRRVQRGLSDGVNPDLVGATETQNSGSSAKGWTSIWCTPATFDPRKFYMSWCLISYSPSGATGRRPQAPPLWATQAHRPPMARRVPRLQGGTYRRS